jgi:hypothetical protein
VEFRLFLSPDNPEMPDGMNRPVSLWLSRLPNSKWFGLRFSGLLWLAEPDGSVLNTLKSPRRKFEYSSRGPGERS